MVHLGSREYWFECLDMWFYARNEWFQGLLIAEKNFRIQKKKKKDAGSSSYHLYAFN